MDMHAILIMVVIFISESFAVPATYTTYDQWSAWSGCLGPCGGTGTRQRTRGCSFNLLGIIHFSAKCHREGEQVENCIGFCQQTTKAVLPAIPIGVWSNWGMFSSCDKICGGGLQIRHRVCSGGTCVGDSLESASCNSNQCPGKWGEWGPFSSCDKTCGSGIHIRRRVCSIGTCIGDSLEAASCNDQDCPEKRFLLLPFLDIPVHYDHWSSWGECLGPCGGTGTRQRIRGCHQIQFGIMHFSAKCPISGEQKEKCNGICQQTTVAKTTTLGIWGNWGKFSSCDKTCGGGIHIRHRVCGGGNCAGDSLESASCNSHQCPDRLTTASTPATTTTTKQATTSQSATTTHRHSFITIRSNK